MFSERNLKFWRINLNTRADGSEYGIQTIQMNYFNAVEVFFTFLEAKPCHVR